MQTNTGKKHVKPGMSAQNDRAVNPAKFSKNPSARRAGVLEVVSFTCGAAVMVLEMTGSRVVAPYMGTSVVVWTSLIGVVMASLSAGYWLGGIVADRRPDRAVLSRIVLLAAGITAVAALFANPVLGFLSRSFGGGGYVSSVTAAVLGALVLFALPALLLGMVSPFIVRLAMQDVGSSGATIGRFSALSTAGSILGTFLGGLVLISWFASGTILLLVAGTLALTALILDRSARARAGALCAAFLAIAAATQVYGMPMMPVGLHIETMYNHIWITESVRTSLDRRVRIMATDPDGAQSVIYTDDPVELVSDYTKFYNLAFHYNPGIKKVLMLGGGAYCVPRYILEKRPGVSVDVVEIDPGVTEAARNYFFLRDRPGLSIYHEDARMFLNRAASQAERRGSYDAIFEDVFGSSYSVPFHMATVEAARRMYDLLTPDGVMIANVISAWSGPRSRVFQGIYGAVSEVFPRVLIFPASNPNPAFDLLRQNLMIVAFKSPALPPVPASPEPEILPLLSHLRSDPYHPGIPAFTDAFAPVERYSIVR